MLNVNFVCMEKCTLYTEIKINYREVILSYPQSTWGACMHVLHSCVNVYAYMYDACVHVCDVHVHMYAHMCV